MAHTFFKSPDNKYAVFSTVSDSFIFWDYDNLETLKQHYVRMMMERKEQELKEQFDEAIDRMERGVMRFMDYDEACKLHNKNSPKKDKVLVVPLPK